MIRSNIGQQPQRNRGANLTGTVHGMHASHCSIWDIPAGAEPEAILAAGVEKDEIAAYLSEVRPLYDAAKRCIGQLSGLMLLLQTCSLERQRDELLLTSVARQLTEADDRLRALKAPASAASHSAALGDLVVLLKQIVSKLDRLSDLIDPASPELDAVVDALFVAQRSLHVVSTPRGGLSPVDFGAACCNCRRPLKN